MKKWIHVYAFALPLLLLGQVGHAAQTYGTFNDAFGAAGLDTNWKAIDPNGVVPAVVDESVAVPSNDGKVLEVDGSQALLATGTEDWRSVTVSASILPLQTSLSVQGVIAAAGNGFAFNNTDAYFAATFLNANGQSIIRLWLNGGNIDQGFPGNTAPVDVPAPGNPFDGKYHKLTLKVVRDNNKPLIAALWDDVQVTQFGPDPFWNIRTPMGRVGVFSWFRAPGDKTRYDNFQATWDDAPAAPAALTNQFTDKFQSSGLDAHWATGDINQPTTIVDESATLPSGDGKVLALDGGNELTVRGTEEWKNVTVSCSLLPVDTDLVAQGVLAGASSGLYAAKGDAYFAATFLRDNAGNSMIRLWLNGADVVGDFPGNFGAEAACPGNPLDGNYHKLTLKVNRDGVSPLLTALWDDVEVVTFAADQSWNDRVPKGRVGLFSWFRAPGEITRYDNFVASTTDTVPVELSAFSAE